MIEVGRMMDNGVVTDLSLTPAALRETFESLPLGCFVLGSAQEILEVNHGATSLLKRERGALIGRYIGQCLEHHHRERFEGCMAALRKGSTDVLELEFVDEVGATVPIEARVVKVGSGLDTGVCYLLTASDLSERYRAEERLRTQQAALARAYRFLTLREMTRGLAHEINQPLTAILNYANGGLRKLSSGQLSPEITRTLLEQIGSQVQRAADVIRRLRSLLQRDPLGKEPCDINLLVSESVKLTQMEVRGSHAQIRIVGARNIPVVRVDPLQLVQALVNLILNALESMGREPAITPRLVIATRLDGKNKVEVAIHDNGPGIIEEIVAIMSDPLFSTEYSSIRMGLPVTRAIIESHGGRLWATSNRRRGITLRLSLPCTEESSDVATTDCIRSR